jgi:GAF domain-containing protein
MKFPFFKKRPTQENEAPEQTDTVQTLRDRILNTVLIGSLIVGPLVYFMVVIRSIDKTPPFAFIIYTAAIGWILVVSLIHFVIKKLPYWLRAFSLVILIYSLGLTSYLQGGVTTDGAIFMLAFICLTSLFFGSRGMTYSTIISVVTAAAIAGLMSTKTIAPTNPFTSDDVSGWINRGAVLLMLSVIVGLSLTTMLRGLQRNLDKANTIASELEKDQAYMRQHTQDLERRSLQIRTAAEISSSLGIVHEPQMLLQKVVNLVRERFNLYYAGVFLLDESRRYAVLQAGTGDEGTAMIAVRHRLYADETSMVGWTITHRQARIALDIGKDAVRFANPYLPNTRSELSLPLISGDRAIGALTIQSNQPEAFDQDDIAVLQNIADTLAVALDNARLFTELEGNLEEIRSLHSQYLMDAWSKNAPQGKEAEYSFGAQTPSPEDMNIMEVPLALREQTIGQITLESEVELTADERGLVEAVATQAALALENARLLEESQQTALRERLITEITSKIWASPNSDFILQTAIKELGRTLHADEAAIELKLGEEKK